MILKILNDNQPGKGYKNGWGLSIFIESGEKRILFDTGPEESILKYNSEKLDVDLNSLDFIFISHNHWDHVGGAGAINNKNIRVYTPEISKDIENLGFKQIKLDTFYRISEYIYSTGSFKNGKIPEQSLIIIENGKLFLFVGCSHPGIRNIVKFVFEKFGRIYYLIGGFHSPPISEIEDLINFLDYISPCHCSGDETKNYFKKNYPERYIEIDTGKVLKF
ncbi:MAG: MBL fold metallo-hydrolase [Thermoplasmata archaeon]|jgi:7,8-dihydropterin-6-yl-methyl-4-(beta-D-ribofuranosyl)aminobenzene 5'-phosphate synthase